MVILIKLTPEQEALLNQGTCIEGEWYFLPFWFKKLDHLGQYTMHSLGNLPKELTDLLKKHREKEQH